jgi:hypothetical protein
MPEMNDPRFVDAEEEEEEEDVADLPDRQAMSLIDPTSVLGGGGLPLSPTSPTTPPATDPSAPAPVMGAPGPPTIPIPHLPNLPAQNPGGTYSPDTSSASNT